MADTTFFDTLKENFVNVPVGPAPENKIDTATFLEASTSLVSLFDVLGSSAFTVVQNDMNGNIKKLHEYLTANPATGKTLQEIVLAESKEKKKTATQGLLWLTRGLSFTAKALRNNLTNVPPKAAKPEELSVSFNDAYKETLSKYHNFVVRGLFSVAMKACPYREDFYKKLANGSVAPEIVAKVLKQLEEWLEALEKIVAIIEAFFESGNYGKGL